MENIKVGDLVVQSNLEENIPVESIFKVKCILYDSRIVKLSNRLCQSVKVSFDDFTRSWKKLEYTLSNIKDSEVKTVEDLSMSFKVEKGEGSFKILVYANETKIYSCKYSINEEYMDTLIIECMIDEGIKTKYYDIIVTWGEDTTDCVWEGFSILLNISPDGRVLDSSPECTMIRHAEFIEERRYDKDTDSVEFLGNF